MTLSKFKILIGSITTIVATLIPIVLDHKDEIKPVASETPENTVIKKSYIAYDNRFMETEKPKKAEGAKNAR